MYTDASARILTLWEHEDGLRRRVDGKRVGPLDRTSALARHAVAAPRVGEPQILGREQRRRFRRQPAEKQEPPLHAASTASPLGHRAQQKGPVEEAPPLSGRCKRTPVPSTDHPGRAAQACPQCPPSYLPSLAPQVWAGKSVAGGDSADPRRTQDPHAAWGDGPGGHLELPLSSACHPHPHRSSYGERVGAKGPSRSILGRKTLVCPPGMQHSSRRNRSPPSTGDAPWNYSRFSQMCHKPVQRTGCSTKASAPSPATLQGPATQHKAPAGGQSTHFAGTDPPSASCGAGDRKG